MMGKTAEATREDPTGAYVRAILSRPGYNFDLPPRYARQFEERIREAVVFGRAAGYLKEIAGEQDPLENLDLNKLVDGRGHTLPRLAQEFETFSLIGFQFPVGSQDEADLLMRLIKKECGKVTGDVVSDVQTEPDKVVIRMPRIHGENVLREYERLRTSEVVEPEYLHDEQDRVVRGEEKRAWFEKEIFPKPFQEDARELGLVEGKDYAPVGRGSVRPANEDAYYSLLELKTQKELKAEQEKREMYNKERDGILDLAHEIHRGLDRRMRKSGRKKEADSKGPVYDFLAGAAKYVAGLFREKIELGKRAEELNQREADYHRAVATTEQADAEVRAAAEALSVKNLEHTKREESLAKREGELAGRESTLNYQEEVLKAAYTAVLFREGESYEVSAKRIFEISRSMGTQRAAVAKAPADEIIDFEPVEVEPAPPAPLDSEIPEVEATIPPGNRERRMRKLKSPEEDIEEIVARKTREAAAGGKPGS